MSGLAERFREKQPLLFGIFLVIVGSVGSTFAANITLNRGGPVQFAQGVYEIDACQSYISIDLYPTPYINSVPYLGQVVINNLDTNSCANTRIRIKIFQDGSDAPLDIYEGGDGMPINELILDIDENNGVSIPQSEFDDGSIQQPIFDEDFGIWTVNILKPLATMAAVGKITLESGPRPTPTLSP